MADVSQSASHSNDPKEDKLKKDQAKEDKAKEDKANKWANRSRKWLIKDDVLHDIYYWTPDQEALIRKLEEELLTKTEMYTTAAADAEYKNQFWGYVQLVFGFVATTLSFVNASAVPDIIANHNDKKSMEIVSVMNVIIGGVAILGTAVAERLRKKDYAVKASNLERVRVDYQGVADLLKSEMAFPKRSAIDLEARIRRVIQELQEGHIAHQPPPEIKEMFGLMDIRRDGSVCSKAYRWIKSWCFEEDPLDKPLSMITSRASLAQAKFLRNAVKTRSIAKSLKKKGMKKKDIEIIIKSVDAKYKEIAQEDKDEAERSVKAGKEVKQANKLKREAMKQSVKAKQVANEREKEARELKEKLELARQEKAELEEKVNKTKTEADLVRLTNETKAKVKEDLKEEAALEEKWRRKVAADRAARADQEESP